MVSMPPRITALGLILFPGRPVTIIQLHPVTEGCRVNKLVRFCTGLNFSGSYNKEWPFNSNYYEYNSTAPQKWSSNWSYQSIQWQELGSQSLCSETLPAGPAGHSALREWWWPQAGHPLQLQKETHQSDTAQNAEWDFSQACGEIKCDNANWSIGAVVKWNMKPCQDDNCLGIILILYCHIAVEMLLITWIYQTEREWWPLPLLVPLPSPLAV